MPGWCEVSKDASHQLDWLAGGQPEPRPPPKDRAVNKQAPRAPPKEQLALFDGRRWISKRQREAEIRELNERRKEALKRLPLIADLHGFRPTNRLPPATRAQCPDTSKTPCPFIRCRMHLYRNDEPAGRPGLASVPRDKNGFTASVKGDMADGERNTPVLDGDGWVRLQPRPSCALDLANAAQARGRGMSNEEIGEATGRHRTLVARISKQACKKLRDAGVDFDGLMTLLYERSDTT